MWVVLGCMLALTRPGGAAGGGAAAFPEAGTRGALYELRGGRSGGKGGGTPQEGCTKHLLRSAPTLPSPLPLPRVTYGSWERAGERGAMRVRHDDVHASVSWRAGIARRYVSACCIPSNIPSHTIRHGMRQDGELLRAGDTELGISDVGRRARTPAARLSLDLGWQNAAAKRTEAAGPISSHISHPGGIALGAKLAGASAMAAVVLTARVTARVLTEIHGSGRLARRARGVTMPPWLRVATVLTWCVAGGARAAPTNATHGECCAGHSGSTWSGRVGPRPIRRIHATESTAKRSISPHEPIGPPCGLPTAPR